jgi:hypothetical protein
VNGKLATTWHFRANGKFSTDIKVALDNQSVLEVETSLDVGEDCKVAIDLRFARPGASSPPYPKAEDPRPLQLRVLGMRAVPAGKAE